MARIPDYDIAGTSVPRTETPRFADRSRQIRQEGAQALAGAVSNVVQFQAEHDDKLSYAAARGAILKADADARESLRNDSDPYTYESRYRDNLKKAKEAAAKGIRGRQSRALFEADIDADIERGAGQVKEIARGRIADNGRATLQSTIETSLRTALDSPDEASAVASIQTANTAITAARDSGFIDAVAAERLQSGFRDNYAEGRVAIAPLDQRIAMLSKPKGTVAEVIQADRRAALLGRAQEEKRILEARQQAIADRREAKAERAVLQLEQQIASGIPMTEEMGKRWTDAVKGTSFEGEFKQVQASEARVQDMLRKPIGEQVKYVQDREAAIKSEGGSARDIANFNRLRRAVEENVKELQRDPLLYLQNRNDEKFEPLDFQALIGGDPYQESLLDDRVTALEAARKKVGAQVPVRPLLPQEAQQLASVLQSSSPKDQVQLFGSMYSSFRDPKAYQGAMQQIAPDAPVKAFAGMLAGKQAQVTTRRRIFGKDETQTAQNVALTLLEGDAILNATPGDKKQDGTPKVGLYLPETSLLQSEFTDLVGDAFRGRESAAQLAFQAVKSYYVGKAAQTGRIAAGKDDVDTRLVGEAVTAVLGAVSDFNGAGKVLAPWGVSKDQFEDRAESAFRAEALRRGLPKDRIDDLAGDIGLQNAGDNRYRVTVGNNYLTDSLGTPLVIEVETYETSRASLR